MYSIDIFNMDNLFEWLKLKHSQVILQTKLHTFAALMQKKTEDNNLSG